MQFGLSLPIHASYADPQLHVDLAMAAERAGWDGYFVWDHIAWKNGANHMAVTDPWITLAAIAANTKRIRLGPLITPLTRRRPWKIARETIALDHLSKGRLILGVGLGAVAKTEFKAFGEESDDKARGRMLDEALAVITGLWRGELFTFAGEFYQITETKFNPVAVQFPVFPFGLPVAIDVQKKIRVSIIFRRGTIYRASTKDYLTVYSGANRRGNHLDERHASREPFHLSPSGTAAKQSLKTTPRYVSMYFVTAQVRLRSTSDQSLSCSCSRERSQSCKI